MPFARIQSIIAETSNRPTPRRRHALRTPIS